MKNSTKHLLSVIFVALFIVLVAACTPSAPEEFTVEFNSVGGSAVENQVVEAGGKVDEPTAPTRTDYIFDGWYKEFALTNEWDFDTDTVDDNMTLYAKWEAAPAPVYYTVEFVGNGGAAPEDMMLLANSLITGISDPVRGGFVFTGWFKEEALTNEWNFATDRVNANTVLYAGWDEVAISYNFVFNSNGGSEVATQSVAAGAKATVPMNPTKSGYVFVGWFTTSALTTQWNFDTMLVNGHKTVYAGWGHIVTEVLNNGYDDETYVILDGRLMHNIAQPVKDGYIFSGWFTDQEFINEYNFNEPVVSDVTLYVKWISEILISFDTLGGSSMDAIIIPQGEGLPSLLTPTKPDLRFVGWYKDSNLSEPLLTSDVFMEDATLYARFEEDWGNGIAIYHEQQLLDLFQGIGFDLTVGNKYVLLNDLDFSGYEVLSSGATFGGTFDGLGHKLSNITATSPGGNKRGVFFKVLTGTIKNLVIENSHFTGGGEATGFLVAHAHGGAVFENLEFFMVGVLNSANYTALLAGDDANNSNPSTPITIRNIIVRNYGDVLIEGNEHSGALMGYLRVNGVTLNVENVYVEASVKSKGATAAFVLGRINATVEVNVTNGVFKGSLTGTKQIGAIVGQSNSASTIRITKTFLSDSTFTQNETTVNYWVGNKQGVEIEYTDTFIIEDSVELNRMVSGEPVLQVSTEGVLIDEVNITQSWFDNLGFNELFKYQNQRVVLNREFILTPVDLVLDLSGVESFYLVGDTFNLEVIAAKVLYNDGSFVDIDFAELDIDDTTLDMNANGTYEITVSYQDFVKIVYIKVVEIESMYIYETDFVDLYMVGETLDVSKVYLFANLSNDTITPIDKEDATLVTDFDGNLIGEYGIKYQFDTFETQTISVVVTSPYELDIEQTMVDVVVDKDSTGLETVNGDPQFKSVGQALLFLKKSQLNSSIIKVMWIADGLYFEKLTIDIPNLYMIGESQINTIIDYNQASGMQKPEGGNWGTQGSASVSVKGAATSLVMFRMTISNSFDYANSTINDKQAVALVNEADKAIYHQVAFLGVQDTLYAKLGRQWYLETYIEGAVDFIFGNTGPVFIEASHIHALYRSSSDAVLTAFKGFNGSSALDGVADYGVVFYNNRITADQGDVARTVFFGRPWAQEASVAFIGNKLELTNLNPNGWTEMSGNLPANASFYEYQNVDGSDQVLANTVYGKTLTELEMMNWIDKDVVFATNNGGISFGSTWDYAAQMDLLYNVILV